MGAGGGAHPPTPQQNTFGPTEGQNEQWREANRRRQRQTIRYRGFVPTPPPPRRLLLPYDTALLAGESCTAALCDSVPVHNVTVCQLHGAIQSVQQCHTVLRHCVMRCRSVTVCLLHSVTECLLHCVTECQMHSVTGCLLHNVAACTS